MLYSTYTSKTLVVFTSFQVSRDKSLDLRPFRGSTFNYLPLGGTFPYLKIKVACRALKCVVEDIYYL